MQEVLAVVAEQEIFAQVAVEEVAAGAAMQARRPRAGLRPQAGQPAH